MTVMKRLTQRVGPAPLWAWLVVGLAGTYLVYRHYRTSSPTLNATPAAATVGTAGDTGATGAASGSPLDQSGGDLLSSLLGNGNAYQQLLAALQGGLGAGGSGGAVGGVPAAPAGSSSASAASASVDPTATPSSAGIATTDNTNPYAFPALISGGQTNADLPVDQQIPGLPPNAYVIGGPAQVAPPQFVSFEQASNPLFGPSIAGPTPTTVQSSPTAAPVVYQPGTIIPKGTVQVT